MKTNLTAEPKFNFDISTGDLEILLKCSAAHYDSTCRNASYRLGTDPNHAYRPGAVNGFLAIWRGFGEEMLLDVMQVRGATWRQLDLCCKILEIARMLDNGIYWVRATQLSNEFQEALKFANKTIGEIAIEVPEKSYEQQIVHELKIWPEYFKDNKPWEVRFDDRGFSVGHLIHLREFLPGTGIYSGSEKTVEITKVWKNVPGLADDYVLLEVK